MDKDLISEEGFDYITDINFQPLIYFVKNVGYIFVTFLRNIVVRLDFSVVSRIFFGQI